MKETIIYALDKETNRVVYTKDAQRGLACNCVCFECGENFQAVRGKKRENHFRHNSNINCSGGPETAIHQLAKQIIAENTFMLLPASRLTYTNVRLEHPIENFIPDAIVTAEGVDIHFEILVTNPVSEIKEQFYKAGSHKSVEIDLRRIPYDITPKDLEKEVLQRTDNKRIIFWETMAGTVRETKKDNSLLKLVITVAGAFAALQLVKSIFPPKRRY